MDKTPAIKTKNFCQQTIGDFRTSSRVSFPVADGFLIEINWRKGLANLQAPAGCQLN